MTTATASPTKPESYVRNCYLEARGQETIFHGTDAGILATLDGYAIIPVEEWKRLKGLTGEQV